MDCSNCELKQRQFYCENCLSIHIRDFRNQTQHFATDRQEQIYKASKALETIEPARIRRSTLADYQSRVDDVLSGLAKLRKENDKKRDKLRELREGLAERRRSLSAGKLLPPTISNHATSREAQQLNALSHALSRARSGLVQELVEVFNVVEVGGRPPIGGKAGTKGEWTIGDLILPVPGDIRRYPPDHINAVITHTIHFLSLLTFYLGVKLPFEITWSGEKFGVGQPSISAIKGGEFGSWARWYTKHPLHLSSNPAATNNSGDHATILSSTPATLSPPSTPSSNHTLSAVQKTPPAPRQRAISHSSIPMSISMSESFIEHDPSTPSSFTTALAMLLYNVCYLAYTQNVDIPLSQAGYVLSNLWSVCCSSELGRKSHATAPHLPAPTPPSFPLDFAQLLQATTVNPASRLRPRFTAPSKLRPISSATGGNEVSIAEEEGWDIVEGGEAGSDSGF